MTGIMAHLIQKCIRGKIMGREFMGIVRTTFLIDIKGKIIKIWNNVKVKDHAKEVLETLQNIIKKLKKAPNFFGAFDLYYIERYFYSLIA